MVLKDQSHFHLLHESLPKESVLFGNSVDVSSCRDISAVSVSNCLLLSIENSVVSLELPAIAVLWLSSVQDMGH